MVTTAAQEDGQQHQPIAITYPYTDLAGRLVYEVLRRPGKRFSQRRPDHDRPGEYLANLDGVERVPYRWPALFVAAQRGQTVFVVEGEKDADRLGELNLTATTSAQGASWEWPDDWAEHFRGAGQVVVIADNDAPGRAAAVQRAAVIRTLVSDVRVIEALPGVGDKGDVTDWLDAGRTADELWRVVEATPCVPAPQPADAGVRTRAVTGGVFILDEPSDVPATWGEGENVLWAAGEGLIIAGPQGVGKTTLGQQLALSAVGLRSELLGWPVQPVEGRVLYLACDRPRQAARSMRRMVGEGDRALLDERLVVWKGPLPFNLVREPERLVIMAQQFGADAVFIDSLKDVARKLSDEDTGQAVNEALQHCLAADIEVVALHHQRKEQRSEGKPKQLADVYGSTWITGGAGSVLLLWGEAGDAVVELTHLKQPIADVGPLEVLHDHTTGTTTVERGFNLLAYMRGRPSGVTVSDVAMARFNTVTPKPNQTQKCRRQLEDARARGYVMRPDEPALGGSGGSTAARYYLVSDREEQRR